MEIWITGARYNPHGYFKHSGRLTAIDGRPHDPFIVLQVVDKPYAQVIAGVVHSVKDLLPLPDHTRIMVAWPGKDRSDYFWFNRIDLRAYLQENPDIMDAINAGKEYILKEHE